MGTTVGTILISYDVSDKNYEVKEELKKLGYYSSWKIGEETKKDLPNTTLFRNNTNSNQGLIDMQAVCRSLGVTLQRAVSVLAKEVVGL